MDSTAMLQQSDHIITQEIDDEVIILNLETGEYMGLKTTGLSIWRLLEKPIRVSDLLRQLSDEYDVSEDVIREDTLTFLDSLVNEGIAHAVDA